jgi:hypothetical protein
MIGNIVAAITDGGEAATDFESIATVSVGAGGSTSIDFTSIPSTYQHLQIRGILLNLTTQPQMLVRFNSDSASTYSRHQIEGNGSTASGGAAANATSIIHFINGIESTSTAGSSFVLDILDYKDTNKFKTTRALAGTDKNGTGQVFLVSGNWRNTNAINAITLLPNTSNFAQHSHFALYGIKG